MQKLTDRDIAYDILYGCKQGAMVCMDATLESASPHCRDIFHRLHDDHLRDQWRVWQFLHHKGEYRVAAASRQEVESTGQRMERLARSHRQSRGGHGDFAPAQGGYGGEAAIAAGRWENGREVGWEERERRWNGGYAGSPAGYGATPAYGQATGSAYAPAGRQEYESVGDAYAGSPGMGIVSGTAGAPEAYGTAGTYGTSAGTGFEGGPVSFEPDRNLPEGTRFESERGFAGTGETGGYGSARTARGTDERSGGEGARWSGGSAGMAQRPGDGTRRGFSDPNRPAATGDSRGRGTGRR